MKVIVIGGGWARCAAAISAKKAGASVNIYEKTDSLLGLGNVDENGVLVLKVPKEDINLDKSKMKVCQQYTLKEFAENIVILDTAHAKLMTFYYPLEKLRKIKGLENVKYMEPHAGGKGNSIRYLSVAPRTDDMKVKGLDNLFVGGEKSGLFVGHTDACPIKLQGFHRIYQ